jgi:gamma-F420-2:alpha-L-glutamate ligase
MITIVCAEGGSTIYSLKNAINKMGEKCEILLLSHNDLIVEKEFNINTDLIHSRCGIGDYLDRLTLFSWQVLNILESEEHIFINSLKTIYNSSDKFKTIKILSKNGIITPETALVRDYEDAKKFMNKHNIEYPVILKNSFSKCGLSVKMAKSDEELKKYTENSIWEGTLIQEYIDFKENGKYKDIRVLVVDNEIIGGYRRVSENFITNLHLGNSIEPLNITDEIGEIAIKCAESMEAQIMGVDILPSKNGYYVIETNTAPGTKGFRALGINADEEIAKCLIEHSKR